MTAPDYTGSTPKGETTGRRIGVVTMSGLMSKTAREGPRHADGRQDDERVLLRLPHRLDHARGRPRTGRAGPRKPPMASPGSVPRIPPPARLPQPDASPDCGERC